MSTLQIFLPPFSPDYSGVASALFELGGLLVLHDASGCTGNYLGYDEPRWAEHPTLVYCSGLRHLDAILGADDKLIDRTADAVRKMHPRFTAIIGSPVPMLVGTDYDGIAKELEQRTGIPSFGFDATGLDFYDKGVVMACDALIDRFARPSGAVRPRSLNILGLTPFDFGARGNAQAIRAWFETEGWEVVASLCMGTSLEEIGRMGEAGLNVAVSYSGLQAARHLQKKFGTPYVVGCPIGDGDLMRLRLAGKPLPQPAKDTGRRVLILGEQVLSCMLRDELAARGCRDVVVDVLYQADSNLLERKDAHVWAEKDIRALLSRGGWTDVVADPLYRDLVRDPGVRFHALPAVSVSGKVHWDAVPPYLGKEAQAFIEEVAG